MTAQKIRDLLFPPPIRIGATIQVAPEAPDSEVAEGEEVGRWTPELLKQWRTEELGWTLNQLARALGIDPQTVGHLESGKTRLVSKRGPKYQAMLEDLYEAVYGHDDHGWVEQSVSDMKNHGIAKTVRVRRCRDLVQLQVGERLSHASTVFVANQAKVEMSVDQFKKLARQV